MHYKEWVSYCIFAHLVFFNAPVSAEQAQQVLLQDKKEAAMSSRETSKRIIENLYNYFNKSDLDKMFSLVSENVSQEINNNGVKMGKEEIIKYQKYSREHYKEQVSNLVYMISDDGRYVSVKFVVNGKYLKTDESKIPATGQTFVLDVFNYFEIRNNQIVDVKCFYDEASLIKQYKMPA